MWNPITGCSYCSPGCSNCYARRMAKRLHGMGLYKYRNNFEVTCHEDDLELPFRWRKPSLIFVCSMSDIFHEDVPKQFIYQMFAVMKRCDRHIFQVLTKRPKNIPKSIDWPDNVWCGVTVCTQYEANEKIPLLIKIPSKVRFLSIEPLLERIDAERFLYDGDCAEWCPKGNDCSECNFGFMKMFLRKGSPISQVIAGSESGPVRRNVPIEYLQQLKDQCVNAGVPFFFKQFSCGNVVTKMPELDGKTWNQYPKEFYEWKEKHRGKSKN